MASKTVLDTLFKVSPQQRRFVDEYLVDLNGTQAAIRAGYKKDNAHAQASHLLSLPKIASLVANRRREMAAQAQLSGAQVLAQLARQAFFDPRRLVDGNGNAIPLGELPDDIAMCIQSVEVDRKMEQVELRSPDGEVIETRMEPHVTYKLKFSDRTKSVDMLMRHLGLYEKDNAQTNPVSALFEYIESRKAGALPVKILEAEVVDANPLLPGPDAAGELDDDQVARLS